MSDFDPWGPWDDEPYTPRHARREKKTMTKVIQFLVKSALLLGAIYVVLWIAEALSDLFITIFPF